MAAFVAERIGKPIVPPFTALGVAREGIMRCGVVFNSFTGPDISLTAAGDRGAFRPAFLRLIGHYVFQQLGCLRMTFTTEQPAVVALALRLGAEVEGRKRDHFGKGRDGFVLGLLQEDWKF